MIRPKSAHRKEYKSRPDNWTKALTIANIALAFFTLVYVVLTLNMLSEMKHQNELSRRNLQETLRAHLLITLDSIHLHPQPFSNHPSNTLTAQVRVENNGNTPGQIQFVSVDAFTLSGLQLDIRDSLLRKDNSNFDFSYDESNVSRFVPPHSSINYVAVIEDISGRIKPDGRTFVHYLIFYTDVFQSYHDVYSVTKLDIDFLRRGIAYYPPAYSFHDYSPEETETLVQNTKTAMARAK